MLLLVLSIAARHLHAAAELLQRSVGHHAAYELRLASYEKLQQLSFSFHDRVHSGDLITLGILDIDGVRMFFATGVVRLGAADGADRGGRVSADLDRLAARAC